MTSAGGYGTVNTLGESMDDHEYAVLKCLVTSMGHDLGCKFLTAPGVHCTCGAHSDQRHFRIEANKLLREYEEENKVAQGTQDTEDVPGT